MSEEKRSLKVFLCHAHSDKDAVKALYKRLVQHGIDVWLDKEKLLPGMEWEFEIRKAVRESDVVVVCLSKDFNQAGFRQKEVRLALDTAMEKPEGEIFIIPARLEECDALESLKKWHWVDLFATNGYELLKRALQRRADSVGAELQSMQKGKKIRQPGQTLSSKSEQSKEEQKTEAIPQENIPEPSSEELDNSISITGTVKTQIRLQVTDLEKVFAFLENRLQKLVPNQNKVRTIKRDGYKDGITRDVTYTNRLAWPYRHGNKLVVKCNYDIVVSPGKANLESDELVHRHSYDAILFTGWETKTVLLEIEYSSMWQEQAIKIIEELYDLFGEYVSTEQSNTNTQAATMPETPITINNYGTIAGNVVAGNENDVQSQPAQHVQEALTETKLLVDSDEIEPEKPDIPIQDTKKEPKKPPRKLKTEYIVAIIGAAATIIAALIGILPRIINPPATPEPTAMRTFTPTPPSATPTETLTPTPPSATPTETLTPTPTGLPEEIKPLDPQGNPITMRLVPAGSFTMGGNADDAYSECQKYRNDCSRDWFLDEEPSQDVTLTDYYMDIYEVTNSLYRACVATYGCTEPSNTEYYSNSDYANHPVVYVDWSQAKAYCEWRDTRLPTEAEWEKAARGMANRTYPWGEEIDCTKANYYDGSNYCKDGTTPVGSYEDGKSPYGIYDMAGNVREWTANWYVTYLGNFIDNPNFGTKYRILRGGSWLDFPSVLRVSNRDWDSPNHSNISIGFRCTKDANP